jgi:hypothetical protein
MMAGSFAGITAGVGEGRNFEIQKGEGGGDKPGHLGQSTPAANKKVRTSLIIVIPICLGSLEGAARASKAELHVDCQ